MIMLLNNIDNLIELYTEVNIIDLGKKLGKHLLNIKDGALIGYHGGKAGVIEAVKNKPELLRSYGDTIVNLNSEHEYHTSIASKLSNKIKDRGVNTLPSTIAAFTTMIPAAIDHALDPKHKIKTVIGGAYALHKLNNYRKAHNDDTETH